MRLVIISDTHEHFPELPDGDVLIHCGDMTYGGDPCALLKFTYWLAKQPHKHKVVVPGNHDRLLMWPRRIGPWHQVTQFEYDHVAEVFREAGAHLLIDQEATIGGLKFYGSPWIPEIYTPHVWAFESTLEERREYWKRIPDNTDVLVTHSPARIVGDRTNHGEYCGCPELTKRLFQVRPKLHCFGHIHEGYGLYEPNEERSWISVNAAIRDGGYNPVNAQVVVEI